MYGRQSPEKNSVVINWLRYYEEYFVTKPADPVCGLFLGSVPINGNRQNKHF
jgi:hypothetical protein